MLHSVRPTPIDICQRNNTSSPQMDQPELRMRRKNTPLFIIGRQFIEYLREANEEIGCRGARFSPSRDGCQDRARFMDVEGREGLYERLSRAIFPKSEITGKRLELGPSATEGGWSRLINARGRRHLGRKLTKQNGACAENLCHFSLLGANLSDISTKLPKKAGVVGDEIRLALTDVEIWMYFPGQAVREKRLSRKGRSGLLC